MRSPIATLVVLGINLFPVGALAQSTDGALPPAGICNSILAHSDEEVSTPAYDAPTGTWPATIRPTEQQCRTRWNVRRRPQRVEVVQGRCSGIGHWACRPTTPPPPPSPSACCRDRPSSSSDGYTSRQRFEWVKQQLMLHWARIILESQRVDALGRRMTTVEEVLREHTVYLDMQADSIVTAFGIDNDELVRASTEQPGDGPNSRMERVVAVFNNGSQAFRDEYTRLRDSHYRLEVQVTRGGTRVQPGVNFSVVNVGAGTAIVAGPSADVQHRFGDDVRNAVGASVNAGFGATRGDMWMPDATYALTTEVYYGRLVADAVWLRVGGFHHLSGRTDECNPATEPCGLTGHGGGALLGLGYQAGPVELQARFLAGYGFMRSRTATGAFQRSDGAMLGTLITATLRF